MFDFYGWRRIIRLNIFILILFFSISIAQQRSGNKEQQTPAYNVNVYAVTMAVTVQDKKGRYVNNLEEKDFIVYENNEKKQITYFQHDENAPLSLTVLLDVSGSMGLENKFEECRQALKILAEQILTPKDEIALLVFADGQVEVAARHSTDRKSFLAALDAETAFGKTALNDAVAVSPEYAVRAKNEKRALILITDGIENDSQTTPQQALEIARRVEVPIYVIGYKIPKSEEILAKHRRKSGLTAAGIVENLALFAEATGGQAFFINSSEELLSAFYQIKKEQSHQYIIGYTSYKDNNDYKKIKVTTVKGNYRLRTRKGY